MTIILATITIQMQDIMKEYNITLIQIKIDILKDQFQLV